MNIKLFPIEIPAADPFSQDLLKRQPLLERLSTLVLRAPTPLVLGIDAGWGSGKSKLLEMWAHTLKASGVPVVHFNAWQADYAEEPLAPLLAAIRGEFPKDSKALLKKGVRLLQEIAKSAGPALIKAATAGVLDLQNTDVESAIADAVEKATEEQIKSFANRAAVAEELKAHLSKIAMGSGGSRIVVFIDELDRCRPTFAVSLLERVKHVVDAQGLVFVFALDKSQLAHSVRAIYGESFDGVGYLGRFFDHTIHLPQPDLASYARAILVQRLGIDKISGERGTPQERQFLVDLFSRCCKRFGLSLREVEQCAGKLALSILTVPAKNYIQPEAKVLFSILAQSRPSEYRRLVTEPSYAEALFESLQLGVNTEKERDEAYIDGVIGAILLAVSQELHDSRSSFRKKFEEELEALRRNPPESNLTRAGERMAFLEGVLWLPSQGHRGGFGIANAVGALAIEKEFLDLSDPG